jgi:hypothetical protein
MSCSTEECCGVEYTLCVPNLVDLAMRIRVVIVTNFPFCCRQNNSLLTASIPRVPASSSFSLLDSSIQLGGTPFDVRLCP